MELKAKQDYLFAEILEADYDPEVFQEYMEKHRGVNLDLYSMEELIEIVQKFKGNEKNEKEEEKSQLQSKQEDISQPVKSGNVGEQIELNENLAKIEEGLLKEQQKKSDSINTSTKVYHQLIKKTVFPRLYLQMNQEKQDIRVKIRSYSKEREESLFNNTYIIYLLETSNGWSVKRRFKDFEWLHSRLAQMYPGLPIPPIPKKTAIRSFQDKHLEERMIFFQHFVNRLLHIPELCSDVILQEFLSVPNQQEFATCKERFEIRLANNANKIMSLKGERVINMSEYAVDLKQANFHSTSLEIIKNLNLQLSAFQKALKTATERAFELSSTFTEAYNHFRTNEVGCSQVVELMGDFMSELGYRLDSEYFFVKNNLEDYWAYEEKYQENLLASITKINKQQLQILSRSKNLSIQQSEMEIDESSTKNRTIGEYLSNKEHYRIKLSFIVEELQRHKSQDLAIVAKEWVAALQQYVSGIKELMLSGADQLTKGMCICQGKKLVQVQYLSGKEKLRESVISHR